MVKEIKIKNMCCPSCIKCVRGILGQLGLEIVNVVLGKAEVNTSIGHYDESSIANALKEEGFELIKTQEEGLVEKIKRMIIQDIHHSNSTPLNEKRSTYLERELNVSYNRISKVFSKHTGITLEKYIILQKIERVKELLSYQEHTLSEIAYMLGYSSPQYLSNQFKAVSGMSVSSYKKKESFERLFVSQIA